MTEQTLTHSSQPTGGTYTILVPVQIPCIWYVRLWRWLWGKPMFDFTTRTTKPIPYDASNADV